jgi:hypothetical protein
MRYFRPTEARPSSAAVRQMAGYVLPTWYGYQGWGLLDYFVEQPGRFTLTEAFHANHHALVHRLMTYFPGAEKVESVDGNGRAEVVIVLKSQFEDFACFVGS